MGNVCVHIVRLFMICCLLSGVHLVYCERWSFCVVLCVHRSQVVGLTCVITGILVDKLTGMCIDWSHKC